MFIIHLIDIGHLFVQFCKVLNILGWYAGVEFVREEWSNVVPNFWRMDQYKNYAIKCFRPNTKVIITRFTWTASRADMFKSTRKVYYKLVYMFIF